MVHIIQQHLPALRLVALFFPEVAFVLAIEEKLVRVKFHHVTHRNPIVHFNVIFLPRQGAHTYPHARRRMPSLLGTVLLVLSLLFNGQYMRAAKIVDVVFNSI